MALKKYLDWRGYFEGLYLNWIKAITTTGLAYFGTNAVGAAGLPHLAINAKQAGALFLSITVVEVFKYLNAKPKPETITENEENKV